MTTPSLRTQVTLKVKRWWDVAERTVWTLLQVGIADLLLTALGIPQRWVILIAPLIALAKGALASKFGQVSAATLPTALDAGAKPAVVVQEEPHGRHEAPVLSDISTDLPGISPQKEQP